jgi:hypothetical protein
MNHSNRARAVLSLDGTWQFALRDRTAWGAIRVPGCWEAQGYSKAAEGPARYRRTISIPPAWAGRPIFLECDAVSYACHVSFNGTPAGEHVGLWTPFALDVTAAARPGADNLLELEVFKPGERYPMRSSLAGFLPDVATTFGGIWQSCRLATYTHAFRDVMVETEPDAGRLRVRGQAVALQGELAGTVEVVAWLGERIVAQAEAPVAPDGVLDVTLEIPGPGHWSPEHPALYDMALRWRQDDRVVAEDRRRLGFRQLTAAGRQTLLNGAPIFLRGVLSWGWDPDVIAPFYTAEKARAEFQRLRELGFNLVKLCLFLPNQTYFDVADEEGMLLWVEFPLWLPEVTPALCARAPGEYAEYVRLTRDHPSVVLYTLGCEMDRSVGSALLGALNQVVRGGVSHVLVCDNSGSGESYGGLDFDFADFTDYHPYYDLHYFEPLLDNWRRDWKPARPWIFGEFCDQDGFRDLDELIAANGGRKPWWMTADLPIATWRPEARAIVEAEARMAKSLPGWTVSELVAIASRQALVTRKYTLEAVRRRAGMGGYVITGLRDTPIATSGVLDDLGRPKWDPAEFRMFNDQAILCLDVGRRRRWTHGGDRPSPVDPFNWWAGDLARWNLILHHTGAPVPAGSLLSWQLARPNAEVLVQGQATTLATLAPGEPQSLAAIECSLPAVGVPEQLTLSVELRRCEVPLRNGAVIVRNRWPVWLYPWPAASDTVGLYDPAYVLDDQVDHVSLGARVAALHGKGLPGVVLATVWDDEVRRYVQRGGRVLFWQQGAGPLPARRGPFWRESLKLFPAHPVWSLFPVQGYVDLQFFGLATDVMFDSERLPQALAGLKALRPILRRLDARSFEMSDYLVEAEIGAGRAILATLRFQGGAGYQPTGFLRNVSGYSLLAFLLRYLEM